MHKLIALLMGTALAVGGGAVVQLAARGDDASATSTTALEPLGTTTAGVATTETEPGEDVSGPCDEAEHANDPRCATAATRTPARAVPLEPGEDISGPCDEVEHANDPRCTGQAGADHDRSGRRGGDDDLDDRDDTSGPGGGDAREDDDHSGRGRGSDDDH